MKMSDPKMFISNSTLGDRWRPWNGHNVLARTTAALAATMPMNSNLDESWPTLRGTLLALSNNNRRKWPVVRGQIMAALPVRASLNCLTCQTCRLIPKVVVVEEGLLLTAITTDLLISEAILSSINLVDVEETEEPIDSNNQSRMAPREYLLRFLLLVAKRSHNTMTSIITILEKVS